MTDLLTRVAAQALDVISRCISPEGIRASALEGGYDQVWARDSMIVTVAACAVGLEDVVPASVASLQTLTGAQSALGYVPLYVHAGGRNDQGDPGGVDSNLWYVIGYHALYRSFGMRDFLADQRESIERAMLWARYQDSDDDGLIESQEAADWGDLLSNRGKVLNVNALYVLALRAYADLADELGLADGPFHLALAHRVVARLRRLHWIEAPLGLLQSAALEREEHTESRRLIELTGSQLWCRPYFLPWVGFRDFGDWCDVLGNCLAILAGVADPQQRRAILSYFEQVEIGAPVPARSIHPPIRPGDKDWREYYRNGNLSLPEQYHNGGAWPLIGGFMISAYVADGRHEQAVKLLEGMAAALERGDAGHGPFSEWYHGRTGRAMGKPLQAWSAASFLLARKAVEDGVPPWPSRSLLDLAAVDQSRLTPAAASDAADESESQG